MHTAALTDLPVLKAGLGFREPILADLFLHRADVDFLEIVADRYLDVTPEKEHELELLTANFPVIPHAINLSLGSAEGLDAAYLGKLAALVNRIQPPWWSEHISFTHAGGVDIGHLTPLPFSRQAVDTICRNVATVREQTDVPLILENVTYTVNMPFAEMTEAQFLCEILDRTDCGLLLDVTNLYTNSVNHRFDALKFLDNLPLDRVVQLHFTGGHWHDGELIDSHSRSTPDEVWQLLEAVLSRTLCKGVILERDENIPQFTELAAELTRARDIGKRCGRWT